MWDRRVVFNSIDGSYTATTHQGRRLRIKNVPLMLDNDTGNKPNACAQPVKERHASNVSYDKPVVYTNPDDASEDNTKQTLEDQKSCKPIVSVKSKKEQPSGTTKVGINNESVDEPTIEGQVVVIKVQEGSGLLENSTKNNQVQPNMALSDVQQVEHYVGSNERDSGQTRAQLVVTTSIYNYTSQIQVKPDMDTCGVQRTEEVEVMVYPPGLETHTIEAYLVPTVKGNKAKWSDQVFKQVLGVANFKKLSQAKDTCSKFKKVVFDPGGF